MHWRGNGSGKVNALILCIQTVSKGKIGSLITTLSASKMQQMRASLLFALGF